MLRRLSPAAIGGPFFAKRWTHHVDEVLGADAGAFDPAKYERWFETRLGRRVWHDESRALRRLLGDVAGARVLDAGSGTGRLALDLAAAGARVTGLDRSAAMLAWSKEKSAEAGPRASVRWVRGDVARPPFADESFEAAVAMTVLCFARDPACAVRELARVTRPGGRIVIGELGRHSLWTAARRIRGGRWSDVRFWTRRELVALLIDCGLQPDGHAAAVFYPPPFRPLVPPALDAWLGRRFTLGAAFIAVAAEKPVDMRS